jgi:hypothetical protein
MEKNLSKAPSGAKLEIADMITTRIAAILKGDLEKADLASAIDINSRLGEVLATQWRKSWRDGSNWKEKIWKQGNCSKAELVSNPADRISRLEEMIAGLRVAQTHR